MEYTMKKRLWHTACIENNCEELCRLFCDVDNVTYGGLKKIPPVKFEDVYNAIGEPKEDLEKVKEYNNSIFWSYDLKNYRKSNWWIKTSSVDIKDKITIRTANTIKKILELCKE